MDSKYTSHTMRIETMNQKTLKDKSKQQDKKEFEKIKKIIVDSYSQVKKSLKDSEGKDFVSSQTGRYYI